MNPPYQAAEPVVTVDAPWEDPSDTSFGIYSSVLGEDDGRVRLWYHVRRAKEESELSLDQAYVGYAESTDGIHFDKPELNLIDESGSTANNVVIPSKLGGSSVWIDPHAPPRERYKNQSKVYNPDVAMQFHMHSSPDGIHWKFLRRLQLPHRGGWDTQSIIFWDPAIGRYVLYTRRWVAKRHTTAEGNENYRTVRRLESDDLVNWDNQQTVMWPDEEDLSDIRDRRTVGSHRAGKTLRQDADGLLRRGRVQVPGPTRRVRHARQRQLVLVQTASRW